MTTIERLALHREVEARNAERINGGFLKYQMVGRNLRVVIEPSGRKFRISAQQYAPSMPPFDDGWKDTQSQYCASYECALWAFDSMVRNEQRYLEMTRK